MAVCRQRLVEASASHAGALRDLGHALGAGDDAEGVIDQCRITVFEGGFQVGGDVLGRFEVIGEFQGMVLVFGMVCS